MAYQHAIAYQTLDNCQLVSCADISEENGKASTRTTSGS